MSDNNSSGHKLRRQRAERPLNQFTARILLVLIVGTLPLAANAQFSDFVEVDDDTDFFASLPDTRGNDADFGNAIGSVGDLDADGVPDIILTAHRADTNVSSKVDVTQGGQRGVIWIAFLRSDGSIKRSQMIGDGVGGFPRGVLKDGDAFGGKVGTLGDVNGDGVTDIAVSARGDKGRTGAVYILFLRSDGRVNNSTEISSDRGWNGLPPIEPGSYFGHVSVSPLGDLDQDGVPDLLASAREENAGGPEKGAVYILFLNKDGTVKSYQEISDVAGEFTGKLDDGDRFGNDLESIGDLDRDGVTEIAVFAKGDDDGGLNQGAVWILFLKSDGTVDRHQKISETQGGFGDTLGKWDAFGETLTSLGDLDGDGIRDLAVGADYHDEGGGNRGAVWILYLNRNGTVKAQQKIGSNTAGFTGVLGNNDNFAEDAANAGDVNHDGIVDLIVAADSDDHDRLDAASHGRAATYLFFLEGQQQPPTGDNYRQLFSSAPNRSSAGPLDDATVSGSIYAFVEPTTDVQQVKFYIDGVLRQTERQAPYDLAGTASNGNARPFNTSDLDGGNHSFRAEVARKSGGSETTTASVQVANGGGGGAYMQMYSTLPNRSGAAPLHEAAVSVPIYVFVEPTIDVQKVQFYIDGVPRQTERQAPYDLAGTASDGNARPFNTSDLDGGNHSFRADVTRKSGGSETTTASVEVANGGGGGAYMQMYSTLPNRSGAAPLHEAAVSGPIYVFVEPTTDVQKVQFYIDGVPRQTERRAPYDLAGTDSDRTAFPFNTSELDDGQYTFRATVTRSSGGSETTEARVEVAN